MLTAVQLELSKLGEGWANRELLAGSAGSLLRESCAKNPAPRRDLGCAGRWAAGPPAAPRSPLCTPPAQPCRGFCFFPFDFYTGMMHGMFGGGRRGWQSPRTVPAAVVEKGTQSCLPHHPGGSYVPSFPYFGCLPGFFALPTPSHCELRASQPSLCAYQCVCVCLPGGRLGLPSQSDILTWCCDPVVI